MNFKLPISLLAIIVMSIILTECFYVDEKDTTTVVEEKQEPKPKSADEIEFDRLNEFVIERGINICYLNNMLANIELQTIHEADVKYPDFGIKHVEYQNALYKKRKTEIFKRYNIPDSLTIKIHVYADKFCKELSVTP